MLYFRPLMGNFHIKDLRYDLTAFKEEKKIFQIIFKPRYSKIKYRVLCYISEKAMATYSSTLALKIPRWRSLVGCSPRVDKSQTRLSDFTFTIYFHALEKEMATHSSTLAWRIPGTGKPGGQPSMGLHRVGHD